MTVRKLFALAGLAGALLLALMASSAAAAPIVEHFHSTFSDTNPDDSLCGIDGSSSFHERDNVQVLGDGTFKIEFDFTYVFTAAASGKLVEISGATGEKVLGPIDNGDGTVTFFARFNGLLEKLKIPNGPVLSRDVGSVIFRNTFDATTGDPISSVPVIQKGQQPDLDSGFALFCDVIVPALS